MIRQVVIKGFKRFDEVTFDLPGHVVVAGPNNTGKTTLLQAIAAFSLALGFWLRRNAFQRHGGAYMKVPVTRQVFSAVPLRMFDLLWSNRQYAKPIEITVREDNWTVTMEFIADSTEQIYVRPLPGAAPKLLTRSVFWKPTLLEHRPGAEGIPAKDHYEALRLVRDDVPGLVMLDGDVHPNVGPTELTGAGLQRVRWRRYEIESYLVHPAALARYVTQQVGEAGAAQHVADLEHYLHDNFPPAVIADPLGDHVFLNNTKARTQLIAPALEAAGLHGVPYTRYHEIAALMQPEEIHPEVREKLDAIGKAFRL